MSTVFNNSDEEEEGEDEIDEDVISKIVNNVVDGEDLKKSLREFETNLLQSNNDNDVDMNNDKTKIVAQLQYVLNDIKSSTVSDNKLKELKNMMRSVGVELEEDDDKIHTKHVKMIQKSQQHFRSEYKLIIDYTLLQYQKNKPISCKVHFTFWRAAAYHKKELPCNGGYNSGEIGRAHV